MDIILDKIGLIILGYIVFVEIKYLAGDFIE